jgi:hypothetical protein
MKELSFNLGLSASTTANVQDPEVATELLKLYNAINNLAYKVDEYTGSLIAPPTDRPYIPTSTVNRSRYISKAYILTTSALAARTVVNIYSGGLRAGVVTTYPAHAIVLEDTAANDYAPIALQGVVGGFVGLTVGAPYYLSATPGTIQSAATAQKIGFALSATELAFGFLI